MLRFLGEPSQTSSFIQNILYEDSCAGVAVVDLFVSVKSVKDKMEFLARSNNKVLDMIANLKRETGNMKTDYRILMENIQALLKRMSEDHAKIKKRRLIQNASVKEPRGSSPTPTDSENRCPCCRKSESQACSRCGKTTLRNFCLDGCLVCLLSAFGERNHSQMGNEAVLGAIIASLLWLRKRTEVSLGSQVRDVIKRVNGSVLLTESDIHMICRICGLCGTDLESESVPTLPAPEFYEDASEEPQGLMGTSRERSVAGKSRDSSRSREDVTSDAESVFEEALTEPSAPHHMTCMGDLSRGPGGKKNVSTFTASSDGASCWMSKLTTYKTERKKSKARSRVVEKTVEKAGQTQKVARKTPAGIFSSEILVEMSTLTGSTLRFGLSSEENSANVERLNLDPVANPMIKATDDDCCIQEDDPSPCSDSDSLDGICHLDDEMEEFSDISVQNSNKNEISVLPTTRKGVLLRAESKMAKAPFFEIRKCYPVFFVQEIIQKTPKIKGPERLDLATTSAHSQDSELVPLITGGPHQKEILIRRPSSDLVIYIQVEVEDPHAFTPATLITNGHIISHSTQTTADIPQNYSPLQNAIRLEQNQVNGQSLYHVWKDHCTTNLENSQKTIFDDPIIMVGKPELEIRQEDLDNDEETPLDVKETREKSVTFSEVLTEVLVEKDPESRPGEGEKRILGSAVLEAIMNAKLRAHVWLIQNGASVIERMRVAYPQAQAQLEAAAPVVFGRVELEKALSLIREIENDVVDVQLSKAIAILPQLESELRKHLQEKIKNLREINSEHENSVENFFSAVDFWPNEVAVHDSESSEERLSNLLKLLTDLEEAVKSNDYSSDHIALCEYNSSKIYRLLHALTDSIRQMEDRTNVSGLSETLDIASQLDTAVREYDMIIKKQPLDYVSPRKEVVKQSWKREKSLGEVFVKQHLENVRKKVFEMVEEEATDMEGRIEKDFDRLDRLEKENDEALMFVETFLQKSERRAVELGDLKNHLKELSASMSSLYQRLVKEAMRRKKEQALKAKKAEKGNPEEKEPLRETISGLLIALDSLKSRAREKNKVCREILSFTRFEKAAEAEKCWRQPLESSFIDTQTEALTASMKEFKRIGQSSLYLSWTKPEGPFAVTILGYEIFVNGKLNQKVRNPERLQAVLYSVDLSQKTQVQLYALLNGGSRILLASAVYLDT